jgi:hypothetical protein
MIRPGWARLRLRTARDVQPFLGGTRALAAPFNILAEPASAAATVSESERTEEEVAPTIASGGAGVRVGGW